MTSGPIVRTRTYVSLVSLVSILAGVHCLRVFQAAISDDAFILYRYAQHLYEGHGLVWNIGESPIEGFTSLLHVLLLATARSMGVDFLVAGQLLGIAGAVLTCCATAWLGHEVGLGDRRVGIVAATIVALSPALAAWARGGMETTLFTALLALAMASAVMDNRRGASRIWTAMLFLLAMLCRPEALGILLASVCFDVAPLGNRGRRFRRLGAWWPFWGGLLMLLAWKAVYFGQLLPNTYYAKSGGGASALLAGVIYVLRFLAAYGGLNVLLALVPLLLFRTAVRKEILYVLCCVVVFFVHVARVGGDYQYFFRYLVPVLPLLAVLTAQGAIAIWDSTREFPVPRRVVASIAVGGLAILQLTLPSLSELRDRPWLLWRPLRLVNDQDPRFFSRDFEYMGRVLNEIVPPGKSVAAVAVGAVGYYSERPIVDLLGLNDRIIARLPIHPSHQTWTTGHMRGNAAETLRRKPDFIVLPVRPSESPHALPSKSEQAAYPFVSDLLSSPKFQRLYVPESHPLPDGRWINVYRRIRGPTEHEPPSQDVTREPPS
jgi:hypothetical protein